ncbi:MAG: lysophospholipid acyltransferase family protein [Spirochaetes bacterium]|nr:lysophospholipid acyltransferase family protein [Spirochaetota bacterium]
MIKADHKNWAHIIFKIYIDRILKKSFSHFFIVNQVPVLPADKAVLISPNHISWWDGFFIDYLNRNFFKRNAFVMMLEEQLKKNLILNKIGAYSIDPGNIKDIKESLSYTKDLLLNRRNLVVFYPEGILRPFDINPAQLKNGLLKIVKDQHSSFAVLPVAFKISFYNERLPEIYAYFGPVTDSAGLKNNYDDYKGMFIDNIKSVHNASLKRSYIKDLFK